MSELVADETANIEKKEKRKRTLCEAGGGGGGSEGSISSNASSLSNSIKFKYPLLSVIDEVISDEIQEKVTEQTITFISTELETVIINTNETSDILLELTALLKEFGGWAGAALLVSITTYCNLHPNENVFTVLQKIPGMLNYILQHSDIFIKGTEATAKITGTIIFLRMITSYFSARATTAGEDITSLKKKFKDILASTNTAVIPGADTHIDKLREASLKLTQPNVFRKAAQIIQSIPCIIDKIKIFAGSPFIYRISGAMANYTFRLGRFISDAFNLEEIDLSTITSFTTLPDRSEKLGNLNKVVSLIADANDQKIQALSAAVEQADEAVEEADKAVEQADKAVEQAKIDKVISIEDVNPNFNEMHTETDEKTIQIQLASTELTDHDEQVKNIIDDVIKEVIGNNKKQNLEGTVWNLSTVPVSPLNTQESQESQNSQTVGGKRRSKKSKKQTKKSKKSKKQTKKSKKYSRKH